VRNAYAVRQPVVNTYLVRERDRRLIREFAWLLLAATAIGIGMLAFVWLHLEVMRLGYGIHALELRLETLTQTERQLRLEASYLASPGRIESLASEQLNMRAPHLDQVIYAEELE